jgi:hypothetical protein
VTSTPPTGDGKFHNQVIRVADLFVTTYELVGLEFSYCKILGPAVLMFDGTQFINPTFNAENIDTIFWEIPPSRVQVQGAVKFTNCVFSGCTFEGIGIAGPPELRAALERSANPGS